MVGLPSFEEGEIRDWLRPQFDSPALRARAEQTVLKVEVHIRHHSRHHGMRLESVIENTVSRTIARTLADAKRADRLGALDSNARALTWIFSIADKEVVNERKFQDDELIAQTLGADAAELSVRLAPTEDGATAKSGRKKQRRRPIESDRLHDCIRHTIEQWLSVGRRATRHVALSMYLRFEFTQADRHMLAHVYQRESKDAVGQRNHATRKELREITRPCFDEFGGAAAVEQL